MDLEPDEDQRAILGALDTLLRPYETAALHDAPISLTDPALDRALAEAGFLDVASDPELGTATAALVVERLARLPIATQAAADAFVGPLLAPDAARPVCLVEARHWQRPVPFLRVGATIVVLETDRASAFLAEAGDFRAAPESLYAYPVAMLDRLPARRDPLAIEPGLLRARWQCALSAECAGLLAGALRCVITHVSDRQQFGRPIATFQAVRHRLAEAQVRINGVYWLTMKAAADCEPVASAMAALHAQETARMCVYDFHQFLGAMGMTLEHPLHLWTYRLKLLIGALGGRAKQAKSAADALWGTLPD